MACHRAAVSQPEANRRECSRSCGAANVTISRRSGHLPDATRHLNSTACRCFLFPRPVTPNGQSGRSFDASPNGADGKPSPVPELQIAFRQSVYLPRLRHLPDTSRPAYSRICHEPQRQIVTSEALGVHAKGNNRRRQIASGEINRILRLKRFWTLSEKWAP